MSRHLGLHKFIKIFLLETRWVVQTCLPRSQRIKAGGSQFQALLGPEDKWEVSLGKGGRPSLQRCGKLKSRAVPRRWCP